MSSYSWRCLLTTIEWGDVTSILSFAVNSEQQRITGCWQTAQQSLSERGAGGRHRRRVINVLVGYVALRGHLPTTPTTKLYWSHLIIHSRIDWWYMRCVGLWIGWVVGLVNCVCVCGGSMTTTCSSLKFYVINFLQLNIFIVIQCSLLFKFLRKGADSFEYHK